MTENGRFFFFDGRYSEFNDVDEEVEDSWLLQLEKEAMEKMSEIPKEDQEAIETIFEEGLSSRAHKARISKSLALLATRKGGSEIASGTLALPIHFTIDNASSLALPVRTSGTGQ